MRSGIPVRVMTLGVSSLLELRPLSIGGTLRAEEEKGDRVLYKYG